MLMILRENSSEGRGKNKIVEISESYAKIQGKNEKRDTKFSII